MYYLLLHFSFLLSIIIVLICIPCTYVMYILTTFRRKRIPTYLPQILMVFRGPLIILYNGLLFYVQYMYCVI